LPHWPVDATSRLPFLGPFVDEAHFLKHFAQVQQISSNTTAIPARCQRPDAGPAQSTPPALYKSPSLSRPILALFLLLFHTYLHAMAQLNKWVHLAVSPALHSAVWNGYELRSRISAWQFLLAYTPFSLISSPGAWN